MLHARPYNLALNASSSSIKFALYECGSWDAPVLQGKLDQNGAEETNRVASLGPRAAYAQQAVRDKLIEYKQSIASHDEHMPEVRNWRWTAGPSAPGEGPS